MAASVKLPTDFGTTDRLEALRLQLMAGELASRIGARIREAREDLGINQRQLADRIPSDAVNNQRVSDWERGVNKPSDRYMKMIATALDRPVGWFYTEASVETPDLMEALNGNGNGPSQLDRIEEKLDRLLAVVEPVKLLPERVRTMEEVVAEFGELLTERLPAAAPERRQSAGK
jgi:transcriptional regulator with XRE-family HTH domain